MDCSPPGSSVHGILQARRILEWVAIPFSGDLPNPEMEPRSPALQVDSLPSEPPGKPSNKHTNKLVEKEIRCLVNRGGGVVGGGERKEI